VAVDPLATSTAAGVAGLSPTPTSPVLLTRAIVPRMSTAKTMSLAMAVAPTSPRQPRCQSCDGGNAAMPRQHLCSQVVGAVIQYHAKRGHGSVPRYWIRRLPPKRLTKRITATRRTSATSRLLTAAIRLRSTSRHHTRSTPPPPASTRCG
jgi:hypothetical protein